MLAFLQHLLATYGYLVVSLVVMAEGAGIPLPGETILLLGAAYAGAGHLELRWVILAAALGAIAGDNSGYWIGRRGGRALLLRYGHLFRLDGRSLARVEAFYENHGAKTVFLARFVAVLRALSSLLAGANRMPYRRFVIWNAAGGTLWALVIGYLGALFGNHWHRLARWIGRAGLLLAVALGVVLLVIVLRRRLGAAGGRWRGTELGRELTPGVLLLVFASAVFGGVAALVAFAVPLPRLDSAVLGRHLVGPGALTAFMEVVSFVGRPATLLLVGLGLALLAVRRHRWSDALLIALTLGGAEVVNSLWKHFFNRLRPGTADLSSYSFPSGHAAGSMAFFGLLVYLALRAGGSRWRRGWAVAGCALAVLLIGASRVYLGEHYPTDVIGGWAFGLAWLSLTVTEVETWRRRQQTPMPRLRSAGSGEDGAQVSEPEGRV
jgi:membrane protein DedA with SNARE-associated domain/membrane-associated phospholipid phosphatase